MGEVAEGVPPLAGVCGYADAARIGYGVDENVRRLLRYHWTEKRLMEIALERIPATPEWEVKGALSLHQWLAAEHADALRRRIAEMRHPAPPMDVPPDPALEAFMMQVAAAADTVELVVGLYDVAHRALAETYRKHLAHTNPLVDHPTRRPLRFALVEEEETLAWGDAAIAALTQAPAAAERADAWRAHLRGFLAAAGGIAGDAPDADRPPAPAARPPFTPSMRPERDARFTGQYNFEFPPQALYLMTEVPAEERTLALLCKRLLEMDVPELMASFVVEQPGKPWDFYREYARQLWDEARHSMMGEVAFEARGVDWRGIPLNIGFSLRLNLHASPPERQMVLYGIEQGLMPATTGKRYEYETACAAGDPLSAHFMDYDWADEVLHAHIGRRWMRALGLSPSEAVARAHEVHERVWAELERYRPFAPQDRGWWPALVRTALGHESAVDVEALGQYVVVPE